MNLLFSVFEPTKGEAALLAVLGLAVVFVVLAVLVGILMLFKLIFNIKIPSKNKEESVVQPVAIVPIDDDETEIVAAIAAALACMGEEEAAPAPFRIKSIRKLK